METEGRQRNMTLITRILMSIVIATYVGFFVVEAVFWAVPLVNAILLPELNPRLNVAIDLQASVLRSLFVNQGVYNLLLAFGGVYGLRLWNRGNISAAFVLLNFLCLFAVGAALTLLATTQAYALGLLQLIVPAATLPLLARDAGKIGRS